MSEQHHRVSYLSTGADTDRLSVRSKANSVVSSHADNEYDGILAIFSQVETTVLSDWLPGESSTDLRSNARPVDHQRLTVDRELSPRRAASPRKSTRSDVTPSTPPMSRTNRFSVESELGMVVPKVPSFRSIWSNERHPSDDPSQSHDWVENIPSVELGTQTIVPRLRSRSPAKRRPRSSDSSTPTPPPARAAEDASVPIIAGPSDHDTGNAFSTGQIPAPHNISASHLPTASIYDNMLSHNGSDLGSDMASSNQLDEAPRIEPLGRTLFYFGIDSPLRNTLFQAILTPYWYWTGVVLSVFQMILLSYETASDWNQQGSRWHTFADKWYNWCFVILYAFYTFNIIAQCIAFGAFTVRIKTRDDILRGIGYYFRDLIAVFFPIVKPAKVSFASSTSYDDALYEHDDLSIIDDKVERTANEAAREAVAISQRRPEYNELDPTTDHPRPFLRKTWNRIELVSVTLFWIWLGLIARNPSPTALVICISGVSHLRLFRLLDSFASTRIVLSALKTALPLLKTVLFFLGLFLTAYSLTGLQSFNSSLRRTCVWVDPLQLEGNYTTTQNCGSWVDTTTNLKVPFVYTDGTYGARAKGFTCPKYSVCVSDENPYDGTFSFDTFVNALEMVYVVMSQNTYSTTMYQIIDSEYMLSCLFFITGILILNYWLISLLVAILASSFSLVWSSVIDKDTEPKQPVEENMLGPILDKWTGKIYLKAYQILTLMILVDVILQTIFSTDLFLWELILSGLLVIEIFVRFFLYLPNWRNFFTSFINLVDLFLAIVTMVIPAAHGNRRVYAWLSFFQLARFYRFVGLINVAERMFVTVLGNYRTIIDLTLFYFGVTFLASLIACKMIRGSLPYEEDGEVALVSFFNLSNSFIGMYQLSSTENWTEVLYYAIQESDSTAARMAVGITLCAWLFFANFIVLNMFIGVMSQNLSHSVVDKRRQQVRVFVTKYLSSGENMDANNIGDISGTFLLLRGGLRKMMANLRSKGKSKLREGNPVEQLAEKEIIAEFLANQDLDVEDVAALEPTSDSIFSYAATRPLIKFPKGMTTRFWKLFERYPNYYRERKVNREINRDPNDVTKDTLGFRRMATNISSRYESEAGETERPEDYVKFLYEYRTRTATNIASYTQEDNSFDCSLWLFSVDSKIRRFCQHIVPSSHGTRASRIEPQKMTSYSVSTILFLATVGMIVCSCINTPYYHLTETKKAGVSTSSWTWITYLDLVFAAVFFLEFAVKVIADGFHYTPNAYTYSPWNNIDFVVLLSMIVTLFNDIFHGPISRYSRALMALRCLRLITVDRLAQESFHSVFLSGFRNIFIASFIGLCVVFPFSVWGFNIFKNQLDFCNDGNVVGFGDCIEEYQASPQNWNIWAPRAVQKQYFNYDSFNEALLIQFGVLSLEGWVDTLNAMVSSTGTDSNPIQFISMVNGIYPILYNFVGTVLVMTMFLSIIIRNYALSKETAYLTSDQLTWHYMRRTLKLVTPKMKPPYYHPDSVRFTLLQQIMDKRSVYHTIEDIVLTAGTISLMVVHYPMDLQTLKPIYIILAVSAMVHFSLLVLRLWTTGFRMFKRDGWALFALNVTLLVAIFSLVVNDSAATWTSDLQRITVILYLGLWIPKFSSVRHLFRIATTNVFELSTILKTWFLLFLTFAIALNQSFGLTKWGPNGSQTINFRDVPRSLILLFRMSTGEGWNQLMTDFLVNEPYCVQGPMFQSDCGIRWLAYLLFISWNIISMYIYCNLFISVIYDTFWYIYRRTPTTITSKDLEGFQDNWQLFDPSSTGVIKREFLYDFLRRSKGYFSMGIYSNDPDFSVQAILQRTGARKSYVNAYNVDYSAINAYLEHLPVERFRKKRELYNLFCAQALSQSVDGNVKFHRLLKQFPLYVDMDPSKVMDLKGYLKLKVLLYNLRLEMASNFVVRRYRFKKECEEQRRRSTSADRIPPQIVVDVASPRD